MKTFYDQLSSYSASSEEEYKMVRATRVFVSENPNCFERSLLKGHITGSAWIVDLARGEVLLTHHRKLNRWLQLGGHCDGDSNVFRVALREATEESGLRKLVPLSESIFDIDVHEIPLRGLEPEHLHYDIRYIFQASAQEQVTVSDESHSLAWKTLRSIPDIGDRSLSRLAGKTTLYAQDPNSARFGSV